MKNKNLTMIKEESDEDEGSNSVHSLQEPEREDRLSPIPALDLTVGQEAAELKDLE